MGNNKLSINQRIVVTLIYVIVFVIICYCSSGSYDFLTDSKSHYNLLFVSGALLLIFGTYITEPYFTKPIDIITNCIAIILALLSIDDKSDFLGYEYVFYATAGLLLLSVIAVLLYDDRTEGKTETFLYKFVTFCGKSKIAFSVIYILTIISYFRNEPIDFIFFLTFRIVFVSQFIIEETVKRLSDLVDIFNKKTESQECIGEAIGCDNPFLYKVEVDLSIHKESKVRKGDLISLQEQNGECMAGIVVNEKQLLSKKRLSICFLQSADGSPIRIKQQEISGRKRSSIFFRKNLIYSLDLANLEIEDREKIENSLFYKNKDKFIGYVSYGSNIHQIRIELLIENSQDSYSRIKEGSIVTVDIHNRKALYQIIDGITFEEILDKHDKHGYLTGIAQKLGEYNPIKKSINTVKWVPSIYSPVFFDTTEGIEIDLTKSIGILPETSLDIEIKDFDDLVTHNTAILGILGIGKSCLTFELIQKVINNTDCKVICIDITSEYIRALSKYFNGDFLFSVDESKFSKLKDKNSDGNVDDPTSWGNEEYYKVAFLDGIINDFSQSNKRILILNPDRHNVSKAGSLFKIQHKIDLTIAEKVRIISERVFIHAKDKRNVSEIGKAKYLIVFEEAHSLIPEWNSTANEGDKSAVNGTSKVILQGRKYGLGSFVVTQRTANISKSILNQCNTIFGLRIFDDTGKQFLENYIGSNYANTLPSLEERHAIVIGKALKLKQPIIIKLNNKDDIILSTL